MDLYFIRHGQTDWNKQGRMQGSTDIPLNEVGLKQAQEVAGALLEKGLQFNKILSSPLSRALKTAEIINYKMNTTLEVHPQLKEFNFGKWEGQFSKDLKIENLELFNHWLNNGFLVTPPGGDSLGDIQTRLKTFFKKHISFGL